MVSWNNSRLGRNLASSQRGHLSMCKTYRANPEWPSHSSLHLGRLSALPTPHFRLVTPEYVGLLWSRENSGSGRSEPWYTLGCCLETLRRLGPLFKFRAPGFITCRSGVRPRSSTDQNWAFLMSCLCVCSR